MNLPNHESTLLVILMETFCLTLVTAGSFESLDSPQVFHIALTQGTSLTYSIINSLVIMCSKVMVHKSENDNK